MTHVLPLVGFMALLTRAQSPILLPLCDPDDPPQEPKLNDLLKKHTKLQEELDEIVERRLDRERKKLRGQSDGVTKEEREELERLRGVEADRAKTEAEKKQEYEKALGLEREKFGAKETTWKTREQQLAGELTKERVTSRLIAAAQRAGAVDPEDVAELLQRRVVMGEDLQPSVRDAKDPTKVSINSGGDDMTIDELVVELLEKKPHLARAAGGESGGASGGRGTQTGKQGDSKAHTELTALKADLDAKDAQAQKSRSTADITAAQKAQTKYSEALKKTKAA